MPKNDVDPRAEQEAKKTTWIRRVRGIVCCSDALESSVGGTQMHSRNVPQVSNMTLEPQHRKFSL